MTPEPLAEPSVASCLVEVVTRLEDVLFPLGWEQPVCLVAVESARDLEMRTAPPCDDPIGELVGLVAQDHWAAVGVLATGWVHDMGVDGSRVYAVRSEPERRARMGHFVDRTGMAVSFLRLGDDRPAVTTGGPRGDRIDDVCRRAFGLDTSPPDMSITLLWASWWLERVLAAAASSATHVATWPRVARHHLAVREGSPAPTVEDLVEAGRDLEAMGSWEALRSIVAKGRRVVPAIDPAAARWMDDGMFSRWTMQDLPPLSQLREAVAVAVPGEVAAAVHAVLDAWGLP